MRKVEGTEWLKLLRASRIARNIEMNTIIDTGRVEIYVEFYVKYYVICRTVTMLYSVRSASSVIAELLASGVLAAVSPAIWSFHNCRAVFYIVTLRSS